MQFFDPHQGWMMTCSKGHLSTTWLTTLTAKRPLSRTYTKHQSAMIHHSRYRIHQCRYRQFHPSAQGHAHGRRWSRRGRTRKLSSTRSEEAKTKPKASAKARGKAKAKAKGKPEPTAPPSFFGALEMKEEQEDEEEEDDEDLGLDAQEEEWHDS